MVRDVDSDHLSSGPRFDGVRERVSARATHLTRISRVVWLGVILVSATAIMWGDSGSPRPSAGDPMALAGHTRLVEAVAFSPDGRTLASCGFDQTVRLWGVAGWEDGRKAQPTVLPHSSVRYMIAFSPDGSLLASAGDRCLAIWSCRSDYRLLVERLGETHYGLAFSPDGRTLALGTEDGKIRLWDMPSARERAVLPGHSDKVPCIAFSLDGRLMASTGLEGRLVLWDAIRWTKLRVLIDDATSSVRRLAFSPDGRILALAESTFDHGDVKLLDPETGAVRTRLTGHLLGVNALAFSPDGRTLATAGVDRCIKLWDLATSKQILSLENLGWVKSVAFSPDGAWLAYSGLDENIRLRDMRIGPPQVADLPSVPDSARRSGT